MSAGGAVCVFSEGFMDVIGQSNEEAVRACGATPSALESQVGYARVYTTFIWLAVEHAGAWVVPSLDGPITTALSIPVGRCRRWRFVVLARIETTLQ